ncbi:hypothetical protein GCM10011579_086490 [Streptomyces albiflavescens]|uniref:DUF4328 domain-containing protein n=1 Tax=Streptomyces albiflavescens TaxID=1623582 RepID=A0A917YFG5_9ACTN|nr:DUF4328 domain-containing protein [Streptomyces albiflavescens]GGN90538.1 hypothetical protein GCM10011579_086490 [Streptomyces albiflavescens]
MICQRCQQFAASTPEGLCSLCVNAPAPAPAPTPAGTMTPPHGPAWLRSPVGLGKAAAVLLGVVVATDLFAVWADITMYDVTGSLADGEVGDAVQRRADHADSLYSAAGIAQSTALLATIVVYLIWFHRVRINAEVFNPFGHSKGRGWTGWGWFVPVVNLWFPRRIMLDIWDASSPLGRARHGLVDAWWTLWVIALLANRAGFMAYRKAETAGEIQHATGQVMLADVIHIAAAVLAILVVLRLTRMQNEKAHQGPVPVGV